MCRAHAATGPVLAALLLLARGVPAATPADTCAAAKLTAASKKTVSKLACYGKAIKKGIPVDSACLTKAEQKFTTAFAKAEAKGSCRTTGDAAQVEAQVDAMVATLVSDEPGACGAVGDPCGSAPCCPGLVCQPPDPATCQTSTTTPTTTTTTTLPPCGGTVAPSCNGTCPPGLHCAEAAPLVLICICQ
jgi:hypothetical protein